MKMVKYVCVILCLILMVFTMTKMTQKYHMLKGINVLTEEARDYRQNNCEQQRSLVPIVETEVVENKDVNIFVEQLQIFVKTNALEVFSFLPKETPIVIYEGITEFDTWNDVFALYKETVNKDIVFVNMLFVEKETDDIYTWEEGQLVQIGLLDRAKEVLPKRLASGTDSNMKSEDITVDELLERSMEVLAQNKCSHLSLIYDGMIEFLNRNYHMISSFDDFEDHILRKQKYYIDSQNGQIYRVEENIDYLRTELYYVGNL